MAMSTPDFEVIDPKELAELRQKAARYDLLLEFGEVDWDDLDYTHLKVRWPAPERMEGFNDLDDAIDQCRGIVAQSEPPSVDPLPGMWDRSDLEGGETDVCKPRST